MNMFFNGMYIVAYMDSMGQDIRIWAMKKILPTWTSLIKDEIKTYTHENEHGTNNHQIENQNHLPNLHFGVPC